MIALDDLLQEARDLIAAGSLAEAEQRLRQALIKQPRHAMTHHLLGCIYMYALMHAKAIPVLENAVRLDPGCAESHILLGNAYLACSRWSEAAASLELAVAIEPDFAQGWVNLGTALMLSGEDERARAAFDRALGLAPEISEVHSNLATLEFRSKRYIEAERSARRAIELDPKNASACNNLAMTLSAIKRYQEAETWCRRAIELNPASFEPKASLGEILLGLDRNDEAVEAASTLVADFPERSGAHLALARAHNYSGRAVEGEAAARRALELNPTDHHPLITIAQSLRLQNRFEETIEFDRLVVEARPNDSAGYNNLGMDLLMTGHYEEGWRVYEHRLTPREAEERITRPRWDGRPLPGKRLLVSSEQGMGDTVQFARYLPFVKRAARCEVLFECYTVVMPLIRHFEGIDAFVPLPQDFAPPSAEYDFHATLLSLPHLLRIAEPIPADRPYLSVPEASDSHWRERLRDNGKLKVGIRWAGNRFHPNDCNRSCTLRDFAPLAEVEGVELFSLQSFGATDQLLDPPAGMVIEDLGREMVDLVETAAILSNLDLVISVNTAIAHISGALGRKTWILLSYTPDWRWNANFVNTSPWYPTARLFRQNAYRDWPPVLAAVAEFYGRRSAHVNPSRRSDCRGRSARS